MSDSHLERSERHKNSGSTLNIMRSARMRNHDQPTISSVARGHKESWSTYHLERSKRLKKPGSTFHLVRSERMRNHDQPTTLSVARGLKNLGQPITSSKARGLRNLGQSTASKDLCQPTNSSGARGWGILVNILTRARWTGSWGTQILNDTKKIAKSATWGSTSFGTGSKNLNLGRFFPIL